MARPYNPPTQPPKSAIIGIRVTQEMKDAAKVAAAKERRTVSQWVETLISAATEDKK